MGNPEVPETTARPVRWFRRPGSGWLGHGSGRGDLDLLRVSIRRRAADLEPVHLLRHRRNRSSGRTLLPAAPRAPTKILGADPATGKWLSRRSDPRRRISESLATRRRGLRRAPPRPRERGRRVPPRRPTQATRQRESPRGYDHQKPRWNRLDEDDEEAEEEQEHDEGVEGRRGEVRDQRHPRRRYRSSP